MWLIEGTSLILILWITCNGTKAYHLQGQKVKAHLCSDFGKPLPWTSSFPWEFFFYFFIFLFHHPPSDLVFHRNEEKMHWFWCLSSRKSTHTKYGENQLQKKCPTFLRHFCRKVVTQMFPLRVFFFFLFINNPWYFMWWSILTHN